MSKKIGYDVVENLRKVMGTLPEEAPKIKTDFKHLNNAESI